MIITKFMKLFINKFGLIYFLSFFLFNFQLNIGFSLKLFHLFTFFLFLIIIFKKSILRNFNHFDLQDSLMILFYGFYSISAFWTIDNLLSLRGLFGVSLFLFVFFIAKNFFVKITLPDFEKIILSSGLVFNSISLIAYFYGIFIIDNTDNYYRSFGVLYDRGMPRLIGFLDDPNFYLTYNLIFFHFSISNFYKNKWFKYLFYISILTSILTISRGGIIALIISLIIYIPRISFKKIIVPLSIFLLASYFVITNNNFVVNIINKRINDLQDGSGRFEIWEKLIPEYLDHPFGIGILTSPKFNQIITGHYLYLHNTYLDVLIESGFFAIIFMFSFIFYLLYKSIRLFKYQKFILGYTIAFFISLIGLSGIINESFIVLLILISYYGRIYAR